MARFPEIGAEALQVYLHIMDFVRDGKIPVEIQKSHHCTERLLEFSSLLLESGYALFREISSLPLEDDPLLGLLHVVYAFLHLLLDYNESFLEKHDIVVIWRRTVLTNLLDANPA